MDVLAASSMNVELPDDYIAYVEGGGLPEGFANGMPGYVALWNPDEIEEVNAAYGVLAGFLGFGSNEGSELLVFDRNGAVFMLPAVGMEPSAAIRVAGSWNEFARRIGAEGALENPWR
jgi:hypothetical protein